MSAALVHARYVVAGHGGLPVVGPLSFEVFVGDALAVRGAPSSGKSTLLAMLLGRSQLLSGSCELFGRPLRNSAWSVKAWSLPLGAVWSARDAPEGLTVHQVLVLAGAADASGEFADARVWEWIGATQLTQRLEAEVGVLSGGERTVLAMACALARSESGLLIVDDLSASLQPKIADRLVSMLAEDVRSGRRAVIFTESNEAMADMIATSSITIREP